MSNDNPNRTPAGVPTGGQFAASAKSESGVTLGGPPTVGPDFAAKFRPEVNALDKRWRDEADVAGVFNTLVLNLAKRVHGASEEDRPGYDKLTEAIEAFEQDSTDDDVAEEVLCCLEDITDPANMDVAEDENGRHVRLADGKPAQTCPDCGNGYATDRVLAVHRDECTDLDVTRDYSLDRDEDEDAHDVLHSAAESFASDINSDGRPEQVAFLRRMGVDDEDILDATDGPGDPDEALDDLVIDAASQVASQAYNDGESDGDKVSETLEGKRWMLSGGRTLTDKRAAALAAGECTDVTIGAPGGPITFRVSYNEWVPDGDDNTPAHGYLRGEFSAETEWHAYQAPLAHETSPFKADRTGDRSRSVGYTYDEFASSLRTAAHKAAAQRDADPLRDFIND